MPRGWQNAPTLTRGKEPFCRRAAWAWMVEAAAYKPTPVNVSGHILTLDRGQFSYSIRHLGEIWGWDKNKVSRYLETELKANRIQVSNRDTRLLVTICNYEQFCLPSLETGTSSGTEAGQERDTTGTQKKEGKKGNEGKKDLPGERSSARGARLPMDFAIPDDWLRDATTERARANLPPIDLVTEGVKMVNWAISKGEAKRDWRRTWINWTLNAKGPQNGGHINGTQHQQRDLQGERRSGLVAGAIRRMEARNAGPGGTGEPH